MSSSDPAPETTLEEDGTERGSYAAVVLPIASLILIETVFFVFVGSDQAEQTPEQKRDRGTVLRNQVYRLPLAQFEFDATEQPAPAPRTVLARAHLPRS